MKIVEKKYADCLSMKIVEENAENYSIKRVCRLLGLIMPCSDIVLNNLHRHLYVYERPWTPIESWLYVAFVHVGSCLYGGITNHLLVRVNKFKYQQHLSLCDGRQNTRPPITCISQSPSIVILNDNNPNVCVCTHTHTHTHTHARARASEEKYSHITIYNYF